MRFTACYRSLDRNRKSSGGVRYRRFTAGDSFAARIDFIDWAGRSIRQIQLVELTPDPVPVQANVERIPLASIAA